MTTRRRRWLLPTIALAAAWLGVGCASAQQARVDRIDIVEFGLYQAVTVGNTATPWTASGNTKIVAEVRFYDATTRVPMRPGVRFGIRFLPVGAPERAQAMLREIWRLPAPGLRNPKTGNVYRETTEDFVTTVGLARLRGYALDADWEMVPGNWTIEIWSGSRKFASKTFTLFKP